MNENGEYCIIWRPFCTFGGLPYQKGRSYQWDHLTFGFYLPPGGPQRLPLPLPHWRQDKKYPNNDESKEFGPAYEVENIFQNSKSGTELDAEVDTTGNDVENDLSQGDNVVSLVDNSVNVNNYDNNERQA